MGEQSKAFQLRNFGRGLAVGAVLLRGVGLRFCGVSGSFPQEASFYSSPPLEGVNDGGQEILMPVS